MAEILGPAAPKLTPDEIISRFGRSIEDGIRAADDPSADFERCTLLNQARMNLQFVKGNHYTVPGQVTTPYGQITDYVSVDLSGRQEDTGAEVRLCPPLNLVGGDLFKYMAVMGQSSPAVKAPISGTCGPNRRLTGNGAMWRNSSTPQDRRLFAERG
jgi:hypothetical protein